MIDQSNSIWLIFNRLIKKAISLFKPNINFTIVWLLITNIFQYVKNNFFLGF